MDCFCHYIRSVNNGHVLIVCGRRCNCLDRGSQLVYTRSPLTYFTVRPRCFCSVRPPSHVVRKQTAASQHDRHLNPTPSVCSLNVRTFLSLRVTYWTATSIWPRWSSRPITASFACPPSSYQPSPGRPRGRPWRTCLSTIERLMWTRDPHTVLASIQRGRVRWIVQEGVDSWRRLCRQGCTPPDDDDDDDANDNFYFYSMNLILQVTWA